MKDPYLADLRKAIEFRIKGNLFRYMLLINCLCIYLEESGIFHNNSDIREANDTILSILAEMSSFVLKDGQSKPASIFDLTREEKISLILKGTTMTEKILRTEYLP